MTGKKTPGNDLAAETRILKEAYRSYNMRDIDRALKVMHADVDWSNGMEGTIEHGHEAVRNYWTRQWTMIDPTVEPLEFAREEDGRVNIKVHQVVNDLTGKLLADQIVHHIYQMENGLIRSMEIRPA